MARIVLRADGWFESGATAPHNTPAQIAYLEKQIIKSRVTALNDRYLGEDDLIAEISKIDLHRAFRGAPYLEGTSLLVSRAGLVLVDQEYVPLPGYGLPAEIFLGTLLRR